jgi:AcrR family transcriptional regulator
MTPLPIWCFDGWQTVIMTAPEKAVSRARRGGRPTREEAERLGYAARDAALRLFLESGYEATSMDAIAAEAGTTKATLYARFGSKEAIFRAVLEWAVGRQDWPEPEPEPKPGPPDLDDLEGALREIAHASVHRATHPSMVKLARIAASESSRFPEVARRASAAPQWPRSHVVVQLLERHAASGAIALPGEAEMLAELFLGMVASIPARLASLGITRDPGEQREHTELAVRLFLLGLRPG